MPNRLTVWTLVILVAAAFAGLLGFLTLPHLGPPEPPAFASVQELADWARARGLHCRSDLRSGEVGPAVAVSTRPLTWQDANTLRKGTGPGGSELPAWAGVLWAARLSPNLADMPGPPWDRPCRVWGNLLVTGDQDLLDRIEQERQGE